MAESRFLWISALAAARRDAVSSPAGRLAACFRSMSSAAKRRPPPCFSASALRCACTSAWRTRSASALRRASSSSLRRRSASSRSRAFCSSSILREKVSRPARKSGAGAPGPEGLRGSLAIHCLHKADLPQGGELLVRFLHVVREEISLAQVFARAAMARVQLERAMVVLEGEIELPGVAVSVTEEIVNVGVAIVLQERLVQALDGAFPVLRFDRLL